MDWGRFYFPSRVLFLNCSFALIVLLLLPAFSRADQTGRLIAAARAQVGVTLEYDPSYQSLKYPGGDIPIRKGVCSDVLVRALRALGTDLQKDVHEDMQENFSRYPRHWGLKAPDANIDHRRVPNLMVFFERKGLSLPISGAAGSYAPGDFVAWDLGGGIEHIGLVSDRRSPDGTFFIIHNIGAGVQEKDILFKFKIIGHYRWFGR